MDEADLSAKRGCSADLATFYRGIRLFYDPRGRATRTELFALPMFAAALLAVLYFTTRLFLPQFGGASWETVIAAIVFVAIPAAAARRFHDIGKSGWFALPVLAMCGVGLWDAWKDIEAGPYASHDLFGNNPIADFVFTGICVLYAVILMQSPKDLKNPYGPNPRPAPKQI